MQLSNAKGRDNLHQSFLSKLFCIQFKKCLDYTLHLNSILFVCVTFKTFSMMWSGPQQICWCVCLMHTNPGGCKQSLWTLSGTVGSNCTTLGVLGNGEKMFGESQGDFWQFLENVAEVITRLWWSAISASCWDSEMCAGQNKMFDALRWKKKLECLPEASINHAGNWFLLQCWG